ncbi:MAG: tRNA (adenosine(37)-N6)-dimethylallyltransferase MiaA [Alphaproteobacteria bacterium]|nr:tRNA (adenosine(37)-N6)-dimethylallyltransferase MiaA [Alphaproteobacteria bacterium]
MPEETTIHIIAGPTASGKSARAMEIAKELDGVIINCDSQQIYDGLPILTAQPSEEDKAKIPHKLYAALDPNEVCSAGHWREIAEPLIEETLAQSRTPIICGGTGLYIKALIDGLSPMPDIPEDVRARAIEMHENWPIEDIFAAVESRDPVMAERLDSQNRARLIRAWEVFEATGKSLAVWQELPRQKPPAHWHFEIHKVLPAREELYRRCNERFEIMLQNGAFEETAAFGEKIERGEVKQGAPLTKALGFPQLWNYIRLKSEQGQTSITWNSAQNDPEFAPFLSEAQAQTRHYAKRQNTWFTNQL